MYDTPESENPAAHELASVHTDSLTQIFHQFGVSLAVTTYQAGKLILARADGELTNTHFREFTNPMGLTHDGRRMALGTSSHIWELHNVPAAVGRLQPAGRHDACYIPRGIQVTGDVDVHEMAWVGDDVWFINTRFSSLCTLDKRYSFVPRWRPPFVSAYDLRDRCHLNGLGLRDGRPRYVTALGVSDEPGGWRKNKADGGILMDLRGDRLLCRGLSMPHSPRWHQGHLWVLESGKGSLAQVDPRTGGVTPVAELPGFTRGLDFLGNLAFIGLSQVRESAVFAGLPLTRAQPVRQCGVWVVDIRTGQTVAFLRFEKGVREIFAVAVLPCRFPEVVTDDQALLGATYVLPDEALKTAVQPNPGWEFAESHFEDGNKHYNEGRVEEAVACYEKALALVPDLLPARFNMGVALAKLRRFEQAVAQLERVVAEEAGHSEAYFSLGHIHGRMGRHHEALHNLEKAVEIRPDFIQARASLGATLLKLGEYRRAWSEWEWRWRNAAIPGLTGKQPQWDGSAMPDKTLLVYVGQEAADAILFARFLPMAAGRCGRLILACPRELIPVLSGLSCAAACFEPADISQHASDAHAHLMALPRLFGITLEDLPNRMPYLHAGKTAGPNPDLEGEGVKVGIVWASDPEVADESNHAGFTDWMPLLEVPDIHFYSVRIGPRVGDSDSPRQSPLLTDLSGRLSDYGDIALFLAQFDLIIGVDSAVTRLAGAMGRPVWVVLDSAPDWPFPAGREDSPWYPEMRLFRQSEAGQWGALIKEVRSELQDLTHRLPDENG